MMPLANDVTGLVAASPSPRSSRRVLDSVPQLATDQSTRGRRSASELQFRSWLRVSGIIFRKPRLLARQHAGDGTCRRSTSRCAGRARLAASASCRPLSDDTKPAAEPLTRLKKASGLRDLG